MNVVRTIQVNSAVTAANQPQHQRRYGPVNAVRKMTANSAATVANLLQLVHGLVNVAKPMKENSAAIAERLGNRNGSCQF